MNKAILTFVAFMVTMLNLQAEEIRDVLSGCFPIDKNRQLKYHLIESTRSKKISLIKSVIEEPGVFEAEFIVRPKEDKLPWTCRLNLQENDIYYQLFKKPQGHYVLLKNDVKQNTAKPQGAFLIEWSNKVVATLINYYTKRQPDVHEARYKTQLVIKTYKAEMINFCTNQFWPVFRKLNTEVAMPIKLKQYEIYKQLLKQKYDDWLGEYNSSHLWPQSSSRESVEYLSFNNFANRIGVTLSKESVFKEKKSLLAFQKTINQLAELREQKVAALNDAMQHLHSIEQKHLQDGFISALSTKLDVELLEKE